MEKLATFRIDSELWAQFIELAKSENTNATKLLIRFIQSRIDDDIDKPESVYTDAHIDQSAINTDERIDQRFEQWLKERSTHDHHIKTRLDVQDKWITAIQSKLDPMLISNESVSKKPSIHTLEETLQLITTIYQTNLNTPAHSQRSSQEEISNILITGSYPHPTSKKWNRDEVRKVCKLWDIKTK